MFEGEIKADESYFGDAHKGKQGRDAAGKVAVFGLLKRNSKVYTVVAPNAQSATLLPMLHEKVKPDSITPILTVVMMCLISAILAIFASITARILLKIITTENFWNQAKRHLRKFNSIPKAHFELYLKECEWRFNNSEIKSQIYILKQLVKGNLV